MRKLSTRLLALLVLVLLTAHTGWGQGATTASMSGIVTDGKGEALPGATVIAVHTPTNTTYGVGTNSDGRFNIQGMRVGGPYNIKVTFVGQRDFTRTGVFLSLAQNLRLDVKLDAAAAALEEVVVVQRRDPVINAGRTGAATQVSREQITQLPTISRSLNDFTRLTPQAGGGGSSSFGGSNNRYNNITIDGAVNNDVFGLAASGTPGGQAGTSPIALDALDQIQVTLAPYDVTLGSFTGAGVNAVTRSGTNDLSASIYTFGSNQRLVGQSVTEPRTNYPDFYNYTLGARVGLPIVKDKVFLFVNYEANRVSSPLGFLPGTSDSRVSVANLQTIAAAANSPLYGNYDVGSYLDQTVRTQSNKLFARLDFNLGQNNTLTLRHNFIRAFDENLSRTSINVRFGNNAYRFNNTTNSSVLELNSRLNRFSNKLILTYSAIRDSRGVFGQAGPAYQIQDGGITYNLGQERSSVGNALDQDIVEITDNLTRNFGKHTITLGTHNEGYKFRNLFLNNAAGYYTFSSISNFVNARASSVTLSYPTADGGEASFKAAQLGAYLQDEYTPVENLRLTYGIRFDVPLFIDKPGDNTAFNTFVNANQPGFSSEYKTTNTPNGQFLFSPRLGFNWDVNNDGKVQVRGGSGIFTGRVPFVWISNSYTNSGLIQGSVSAPVTTGVTYPVQLSVAEIRQNTTLTPAAQSQINLLRDDFRLPQVWRSNLAADFRLPGDVIATVEGIYSKTINDIYYRDLNLRAPVGRLAGPDQRPIYDAAVANRRIDSRYTNVYYLDNTNQGYRYNATIQLQKRFLNGLNATAAYTYGVAKEINSGTSSTAASNYQFNQVAADPNNPELGFSRNDQRHRVIGSAGYTFRYANDHLATTLTVFYEGLSGQPLTYIYGQNTDLNRDGNTSNDLLYIPRDVYDPNEIRLVASEGRTLAQVQAQLEAFIAADPYLNSHRGQVAERFAARLPWTHEVDVRVAQDISVLAGTKRNALQLTLDIFNLGNLLNYNWGRQYTVANNATELLRVESTGPNAQPTFSFPAAFTTNNRSYDFSNLTSRWRMQVGVRYSFN